MGNIYIVVYNTPDLTKFGEISINNKSTTDFIEKLKSHNSWHYDVGDDPSFYWHNKQNVLTWGICRTNIRNKIKPNDLVLYFCFCANCNAYYLTGLATVEKLIKQTDIWTNGQYSVFQKYFNLLIKKNVLKNNWVHYEPLFNQKGMHKDWVYRISDTKKDPSEFDFKNDELKPAYLIKGNYVIFKSGISETYILKSQIEVANWKKNDYKETWISNDIVNKIKELTFRFVNKDLNFGKSKRDSLRVHDRNQAHVHIRIEVDNDKLNDWKKELIEYLQKLDNQKIGTQ